MNSHVNDLEKLGNGFTAVEKDSSPGLPFHLSVWEGMWMFPIPGQVATWVLRKQNLR